MTHNILPPSDLNSDADVINKDLALVVNASLEVLGGQLLALVLYGSMARGNANSNSDIDIYAITKDKTLERKHQQARISIKLCQTEKRVDIHLASQSDFAIERLPFHTAAKRDGIVVWGDIELAESSLPYSDRYRNFFQRSFRWETGKVRPWGKADDEDRIHFSSLIHETCLVASKHAIQCCLQMRGEGYSSKYEKLADSACQYWPIAAKAFNGLRAIKDPEDDDTIGSESIELAYKVFPIYQQTAESFGIELER